MAPGCVHIYTHAREHPSSPPAMLTQLLCRRQLLKRLLAIFSFLHDSLACMRPCLCRALASLADCPLA